MELNREVRMGQRDLAQNEYFKDKLRFADVCNGILFQGREVVRPEDLQEKEPDIIFYNSQEQLGEIIVDKIMMWNGICINILGIESQTKVDYSMVFRLMKEEALSYEKQWDGARCLYDMLDMSRDVEPYISNYKMNLFDFHDCRDFSVFKTENRLLFETLASCENKKKMYDFMKLHEEEYEKWDVLTTKLMCDLLGLKHDRIVKKVIEEGKGMCRAVEELMEDAREEERILSVRNMCKNLKISVEQAMDALMIPINERERLMGRV